MYTYTWKKYLPVIRILLKKSSTGDQSMSLNRTDFEKTSKVRKPNVAFAVEIVKGRFTVSTANNRSAAAKDLLEILQEDDTVKNLLRENRYSVTMTNDFLLTIKQVEAAEEQS